jgi:selenocysteine-specific elongation factor
LPDAIAELDAAEDSALTLGTAGHVDHGKTALVEALTGKNTDRLAEERRRGVSIELGFAELELPGGRSLSVVDVPGHERFVRTMVAGATGIDLFLMVVAADDGVMPQTREHAAVLRALGVHHGVVALTKCDLADTAGRHRAAADARDLMAGAPLIEVSVKTREGLDELLEALQEAAVSVPVRAEVGWSPTEPLLHVDRIFSLRGIGTVVTGTLSSGRIRPGDRIEVLPEALAARVRSVQVHDREKECARAGQRVALNLGGVQRGQIERGAVVSSNGSGLASTYRLDVELDLEPWAGDTSAKRVQVHHGTRDAPARLVALDEEGQLAQLRLEAPLVARAGDHLVIRSIAPPDTLGGGVVLDPHPRRHGSGPEVDRLRLIREAEPDTLIEAALRESPHGLSERPEEWGSSSLLAPALHRYSPDRWREAAAAVMTRGAVVRAGGRLVAPDRARGVRDAAPAPRQQEPGATQAREVIQLLSQDRDRPRVPQALAEALMLQRREVVKLLGTLVDAGELVRLKPDIYYVPEELERLSARALALIRNRGAITIGELRDDLKTSRKYAQALLEYLDGAKQTIRRGDRHVLRGRRTAPSDAGTLPAGRQESGGSTGLQSQ